MSAATGNALPSVCALSARSSIAALSSFSCVRPQIATCAPNAAKLRAMPRLMPLPPPVTKTVLPLKRSRGRRLATSGCISLVSFMRSFPRKHGLRLDLSALEVPAARAFELDQLAVVAGHHDAVLAGRPLAQQLDHLRARLRIEARRPPVHA